MSDTSGSAVPAELLQTVLMQAAANRAAQINRQATAALTRDIRARNARVLRGDPRAGNL